MTMQHDPHRAEFRLPTGAAMATSAVRLALKVSGLARDTRLVGAVRFWTPGSGETRVPMTVERDRDGLWLSATLTMPPAGTLLWYHFAIALDGKETFFGAHGQSDGEPGSWQITVYDRNASTPGWFRHAVMYQIFPDRFARGKFQVKPKQGALLHVNWDDTPHYNFDRQTGEMLDYDFFGGNLAGIRDKLPFLRELGISVIYLNPVFEAESNHRYDTGDYKRVDSWLGTNADFAELVAEARRCGIRFILDGVFSHTGSNSVYFNRRETYNSLGAYQSRKSPYYSWYNFSHWPDKYDSWWGVDTLPNVNETDPAYLDFVVSGEDSVLRHWQSMGVSGWRLDVIDELPEKFSTAFYAELKRLDPDAVLIGEVWENASNKVSYSQQRTYLSGHEIDGAMNYPWRQIVIDFLLGHIDGAETSRRLETLRHDYPRHNFYAMMNLLGSHDRVRIVNILGEGDDGNGWSQARQAAYRLSPDQMSLALARLRLALVWQMTFPGVPSIYYGDEIAMQGLADPYNRRPYDWAHGNAAFRNEVRTVVQLRNRETALQTGEFLPLIGDGDIYAYARTIRHGRDAFGEPADDATLVTVINRGREPRKVALSLGDLVCANATLDNLLRCGAATQEPLALAHGHADLEMPPMSAVVYKARLAPLTATREAGILLHLTSLPHGDLGDDAYRFVDFLASAGQSVWQILPLTPPDAFGSPYASPSAFAGNAELISLDYLVRDGLLTADECTEAAALRLPKRRLLRKAFRRFRGDSDFAQFVSYNADWLNDYATFAALHDRHRAGWWDWPLLTAADEEERELVRFEQYVFQRQWTALHDYARERGVRILGDLPLYVALDSADVWAHRQLFALDADGHPEQVAGVPPDYFSADGQLWGNPVYDWDAMAADGFAWWVARLRRLGSLVDMVRIDHFRGLQQFWSVDGGAATAREGRWRQGPGADFLAAVRKALPNLPLVAEDLGVWSPDVDKLRHDFALPGMTVLEFALTDNGSGRVGCVVDEDCVVYTGTHDNNTAAGWFADDLGREQQARLLEYLALPATATPADVARALVATAYRSRARLAVAPMQDVLALDGSCRLNQPGVAGGNWSWRLAPDALSRDVAARLAALAKDTGRCALP